MLGARMTEPEGVTKVRGGQQEVREKGAIGKAVIKRSKAETSSRGQGEAVEGRQSGGGQPDSRATGDEELIVRIRHRAYLLFEAAGREHGQDLEHWLEAERQITGSSTRSER